MLNQTKISHDWRVTLAVATGVLVLCLVLTAFRALGATSRPLTYHTVSDKDIFDRVNMANVAQAKSSRAAYLLHAYGRNAEVAQLKLWYLKKAAFWFRGALAILVVLVVLVVIYAVHGGMSHPPAPHHLGPPAFRRWSRRTFQP